MDHEINTANDSMVGTQGGEIRIMANVSRISKDQALRLAAYIVALTDRDEFEKVLQAIENT